MKKIAVLFVVFLQVISLSARENTTTPDQLSVLKRNVINYYVEKRHTINKEKLQVLLKTLKDNGSWPDIDYTSKQRGEWPTCDHLYRTLDLAIAYRSSESHDKYTILKAVKSCVDYWITNDFICPNWWYPEIGVPKLLGPIMLLIQPSLTNEEFEKGIKILQRAKIGMTGQNKVWLSGNVIYHSILTGDTAMIRKASQFIQSEVEITEGEGIQADQSFHQHGPQQQFGNYGLAFASDILQWAEILDNTNYQFENNKIGILRNYVLKGMRWVVWKNYFDVSACGRQLFPDAQIAKANNLAAIYKEMSIVDKPYAIKYKEALHDFTGNVHFWKSDMTIQRRPDFYASLKMCSRRVAGSESCNSENISGYHLGDGALMVYRRGNEYENIFPFWDWRKIPGITCFEDKGSLPVLTAQGYTLKSDFVGGVSDGNNGIAGMYYVRDGLEAYKSYFFFKDVVVCLGAGIQSLISKPVSTAVNQCLLKGQVRVNDGNKTSFLTRGEHTFKNIQWVLHDSIGYYFPQKSVLRLDNEEKVGSWDMVMGAMPSTMLRSDIFNLYIEHGLKPLNDSYAYFILPKVNEKRMTDVGSDFNIVSNTKSLQCVHSAKDGLVGIVFYEAGTCTIGKKTMISVDAPCMVMLSGSSDKQIINLSDPTHLLAKIKISISGKHDSKELPGQYDSKENKSEFTVILPMSENAGRTISFGIR